MIKERDVQYMKANRLSNKIVRGVILFIDPLLLSMIKGVACSLFPEPLSGCLAESSVLALGLDFGRALPVTKEAFVSPT